MSTAFWNFDVGNLLTLAGVIVAYLMLRNDQQKAQEARHQTNVEKLEQISKKVESLLHLDGCVDELKTEIAALRDMFMEYVINKK